MVRDLYNQAKAIDVDSKAKELRTYIDGILEEDPDEKVLVLQSTQIPSNTSEIGFSRIRMWQRCTVIFHRHSVKINSRSSKRRQM